jgi:hypothetical protein
VYAISHAATALLLKRRYSSVGLWPLLVAVQAVELLWVLFTYLGVEHIEVSGGDVHLGFLPYSHSVFTGVFLALVAWIGLRGWRGDRALAVAVALGIVSHIALDIIQHEPNIYLLPAAWGPQLGLGLTHYPLANLLVELAYGVLCWWVFRGAIGLLIGIIVFNLLDAPLMFRSAAGAARLGAHPAVLTTVILVQIVATWLVVARLAKPTAHAATNS